MISSAFFTTFLLFFVTASSFHVVTLAILIFGGVFLVLFIERRSLTLAVVYLCTKNLISRRQWAKWGKVCTANIEHRMIFTLSKNHLATPVKGMRTEAHLIGEAGNNAPVGLELIPFERVARLWRRLILTNSNFIGRRQGTNNERFCRATSGRTRPLQPCFVSTN